MSSLSSVPSARSLLSPKSNGHITSDRLPGFGSSPTPVTYQPSLASAKLPDDSLSLRSDELFTKYTVTEVKVVQQRLRADANAKQEELRMMVGERYRDLLQASSSIISIASSSQRVVDALKESKDSISSQHPLPVTPKTAAIDGIGDGHLYTLQVLSAHIKLLLDAPEHLWRLIERKKYFQAAWLFLLARVVHRALVRNDENDEQIWVSEGVDVLAEFPLVQRQWDVVSQFRSQIIHKSTLSLRESSLSTEDTCATLITLHLLDSRPLNETLVTLFLQRSKTLQSLLSWNQSSNANGHASDRSPLSVREVTRVMKDVLNTISETVSTTRTIFQNGSSHPSLILRVLESLQSEYSESDAQSTELPDELLLSTKSLLTQLTSSANFQLLPRNVRSYKPYIDLTSSSTSLSSSEFSQSLQDWFHNSCKQWQDTSEKWLAGLQSVKDIWSLRTSLRRCTIGSGFEETEKDHVHYNLDLLCHKRITAIWRRTLCDAENKFKEGLRENVFSLERQWHPDTSPVDFLFHPLSIPALSQTVKSFVDTPFQRYQLSLKKQLVSRSARLDSVISTLEQCARAIQLDFVQLKTNSEGKTMQVVQQLKKTYEPVATELSIKIVSFIDEAASEAVDSHSDTNGLAFLSRVVTDLAHSSLFVQNIGCRPESVQGWHKMLDINEKIISKWRKLIIDSILRKCRPVSHILASQTPGPGPSPRLFHALLSLCDYISQLGAPHQLERQYVVAQDLLRSFMNLWIRDNLEHEDVEQTQQDLAFLRALSHVYGQSWPETSTLIDDKLKALVRIDTSFSS
ncbi:hypothetical protein CPB84DRAFT_1812046 [Gymnopilus junonius]|uniref:Conserved oligomeric Golgi complex subunit 1 n=1 Tax=Gymnopilus junonius TaxID=109634 RepID=A0A9P5P250_GYMJU|nr:hypothetical protein CPB84DRAFT_1812046 [Gymnopilus junonius]